MMITSANFHDDDENVVMMVMSMNFDDDAECYSLNVLTSPELTPVVSRLVEQPSSSSLA